jgi:phosphoglycolate phosphatase
MKPVELIIFDLDGTIIDSKLDLANSVNFTLKRLGKPEKDVEFIAKFIGRGLSNFIKNTLGDACSDNMDEVREIFMKHYEEHLLDNTVLYPNVEKTLRHFSNKKKVILTNKRTFMTNVILEGLGIRNYFDKVIGAGDLPENKPSPLPVNTLLEMFNVEKDKTIILGDMTIDIETGRNAGIEICSVTYGLCSRADLVSARPDYIIDDMFELTKIIE